MKKLALCAMLLASLAGCKAKLTYVHIAIQPAASEPPGIHSIELQLAMSGQNATKVLTEPGGGDISFPTDITLEIGSGSGQMVITAVAKDVNGKELDRGTQTVTVTTGAITQATVGLAGGAPELTAVEPSHEFGNVLAGGTSASSTFTFRNTGFKPSGTLTAALGGVGASQFQITSDTCNGATLAKDATCTATVVFKPVSVGALASTLTLSGTPGGAASMALTGTGGSNPQQLDVAIVGGGAITGLGITCDTTAGGCTKALEYNTAVTLVPAPNTGAHFDRWTGDCNSTAATCALTMTQAHTVTAWFSQNPVTLTATVDGNGVISTPNSNIDCGTGATVCSAGYFYGDSVTLTAAANAGSHLASWNEPSCADPAQPCTITLTGDRNIHATFALDAVNVTVAIGGNSGGGTVVSADNKISCAGPSGTTCAAVGYSYGDSPALSAVADANSNFVGWTLTSGSCPGNGTCQPTLTGNVTITALFDHKPVAVVVTFQGNGTGSVSDGAASCNTSPCTFIEAYGSAPTFSATADTTAQFTGWGGACNGTGNCTFGALSGDQNLTATFTKAWSVVIAAAGNGAGTITGGGLNCTLNNGSAGGTCSVKVLDGGSIALSFAAAASSVGTANFAGGCTATGATSCAISNITATPATTTVTATLKTFTVGVTAGGNGAGTVTGGSLNCTLSAGSASGTCQTTVNYGSNLTMSFAPATSTQANAAWSGGCVQAGATSCTLTNITSAPASTLATVSLKTFNVVVTAAGNGAGTVTGGSLNCSLNNGSATGTCTTAVNYGSNFTMTFAAAASSQTNAAFSGGCVATGTTTCTLTNVTATPASTAVSATLKTFNVAVQGAGTGTGTITGGALNCSYSSGNSTGTCSTTVNYGSSLTMTLNPAVSTQATADWTVGCVATGAGSCTLTNITAAPATTTSTMSLKTFTVTITKPAIGTITSSESPTPKISCGPTCTTASATYNYGDNVVFNAANMTANQLLFTGYTGCTTTSGLSCTLSSITAAKTVSAGYSTSMCKSTIAYGEVFAGGIVQGCPEAATFANRACASNAHVCSAQEWASTNGGTAPGHHYWTDDALNYSIQGCTLGGSGCGPNSCFVSSGNTNTSNGCSTTPMRVCSPTTPDPEGNQCNWTGCGFNSPTPNQYFGGCSNNTTAGTLCCSNGGFHRWYVNSSTGLDTNAGSLAAPFKTLHKGLSVAASNDTVYATGSFTASIGETWPLVVPAGVALIGDEPNQGKNAQINGCGTVSRLTGAVHLQTGATLAGFAVTCSGQNGVVPVAANTVTRNNTLTGNSFGFYDNLSGANNATLTLNSITGNSQGFVYGGTTSGGKVENNVVSGNSSIGAQIQSATVDLGGGASSSVGGNSFICNTNTDANFGSVASVAGNLWDHVPVSNSTTQTGGIDVVTSSSAVLTSANTSASQSPNACACATPGNGQQFFDGAMTGCKGAVNATTGVNEIAWSSRASLCPAGTHACSAAEWKQHYGATVPTTNYWTGDNPLNYLGPPGSGQTNCAVSATSGSNPCGGGAMLICPDTGTLCQASAVKCGLDSFTVNDHFGGCATSSSSYGIAQGTVCCTN